MSKVLTHHRNYSSSQNRPASRWVVERFFCSQLHAAGPKTFQQIEVSHWNIALYMLSWRFLLFSQFSFPESILVIRHKQSTRVIVMNSDFPLNKKSSHFCFKQKSRPRKASFRSLFRLMLLELEIEGGAIGKELLWFNGPPLRANGGLLKGY